jgi:hypothetical protein
MPATRERFTCAGELKFSSEDGCAALIRFCSEKSEGNVTVVETNHPLRLRLFSSWIWTKRNRALNEGPKRRYVANAAYRSWLSPAVTRYGRLKLCEAPFDSPRIVKCSLDEPTWMTVLCPGFRPSILKSSTQRPKSGCWFAGNNWHPLPHLSSSSEVLIRTHLAT